MNKKIKDLRKALHDMAGNQPSCDPFSHEGSQVWKEWSEGCRELEMALADTGEEI